MPYDASELLLITSTHKIIADNQRANLWDNINFAKINHAEGKVFIVFCTLDTFYRRRNWKFKLNIEKVRLYGSCFWFLYVILTSLALLYKLYIFVWLSGLSAFCWYHYPQIIIAHLISFILKVLGTPRNNTHYTRRYFTYVMLASCYAVHQNYCSLHLSQWNSIDFKNSVQNEQKARNL